MSLVFVLSAMVVIATPGIGAIYTVAAGVSGGVRASVLAALGCALGIVPHALAAVSGVAVLLHTSVWVFHVLRYMGVAYLLYMAISMLAAKNALVFVALGKRLRAQELVVSALLLNLFNPKLSIFFLAFLPQFVDPQAEGATAAMLWLSLYFMLMSFLVFVLYGACAASVRHYILTSVRVQRWMRGVFGVAFLGLSVQLALAEL